MTFETIRYEVDDNGIAVLTLNRPEKLNSFTQVMFDEWREVIAGVAFSDDVRFLIITGTGRAFSSGADLGFLGSEKKSSAFRFYYRQAHQSFEDLDALEVPVIAAINGICYGGGVDHLVFKSPDQVLLNHHAATRNVDQGCRILHR